MKKGIDKPKARTDSQTSLDIIEENVNKLRKTQNNMRAVFKILLNRIGIDSMKYFLNEEKLSLTKKEQQTKTFEIPAKYIEVVTGEAIKQEVEEVKDPEEESIYKKQIEELIRLTKDENDLEKIAQKMKKLDQEKIPVLEQIPSLRRILLSRVLKELDSLKGKPSKDKALLCILGKCVSNFMIIDAKKLFMGTNEERKTAYKKIIEMALEKIRKEELNKVNITKLNIVKLLTKKGS